MRFFIVIAASTLISGCDIACENRTIRESLSSDGRYMAVMFSRSCGATTETSTHISVVKVGELLPVTGNIFVSDTDHGTSNPAAWGGPLVIFEWASPRSLIIRKDPRSRVFRNEGRYGAVQVRYEDIFASQ